MQNGSRTDSVQRWQYVVPWRYGAIALFIVGLIMLGLGASRVSGEAISVTLLPLGFACLLAGVVLPRIEGKFAAGTSGVTAELLAVHKLDSLSYTASAPALTTPNDATGDKVTTQRPAQVKLSDVWDALEGAGFRVTDAATGKRYLEGPERRSLWLHDRGIIGWAAVSDDLLAQLAGWGIHPRASGLYPAPPDIDPNSQWRAYPGAGIMPQP